MMHADTIATFNGVSVNRCDTQVSCMVDIPIAMNQALSANVQHIPGGIFLECDSGVKIIPGYWHKENSGEYILLVVCNGDKRAYKVYIR